MRKILLLLCLALVGCGDDLSGPSSPDAAPAECDWCGLRPKQLLGEACVKDSAEMTVCHAGDGACVDPNGDGQFECRPWGGNCADNNAVDYHDRGGAFVCVPK
jgi:hypothetical protein